MLAHFKWPDFSFDFIVALLVYVVLPVAMLFFLIRWILRYNDHSRPGFFAGLIVTGVVLLGLLVCIPNFIGDGTSKLNAIISNLRVLDGAKQQWALDHHRTDAFAVTREDVAEYMGVSPQKGWVQPVTGERYALRALTEMPEAELTREVEGLPKGTRIRLLPYSTNSSVGTNWRHCDIMLPNKSAAPDAAASRQ